MTGLVRLPTTKGLAAGERVPEIPLRRQLRRIVRETKAAEGRRDFQEEVLQVLVPLADQEAAGQVEGVRGALVVLEAPLAA